MDTLQNRHRPASILIVEDNPGDLMMIKRAFRHAKLPHNLMFAATGEQALSILRKEGDYVAAVRPDIILLDLNLPQMSGKDVLSTIKQDKNLKRIPVMIYSSSADIGDITSSYDLHANSYIVKPADLDKSIAVVEKMEEFWFTLAVLPNANGELDEIHA